MTVSFFTGVRVSSDQKKIGFITLRPKMSFPCASRDIVSGYLNSSCRIMNYCVNSATLHSNSIRPCCSSLRAVMFKSMTVSLT